jgi:hypothetical protein
MAAAGDTTVSAKSGIFSYRAAVGQFRKMSAETWSPVSRRSQCGTMAAHRVKQEC